LAPRERIRSASGSEADSRALAHLNHQPWSIPEPAVVFASVQRALQLWEADSGKMETARHMPDPHLVMVYWYWLQEGKWDECSCPVGLLESILQSLGEPAVLDWDDDGSFADRGHQLDRKTTMGLLLDSVCTDPHQTISANRCRDGNRNHDLGITSIPIVRSQTCQEAEVRDELYRALPPRFPLTGRVSRTAPLHW
jgi:hypothetical protein